VTLTARARPRIVDVVFERARRSPRRFVVWALAFAGGSYLAGGLVLARWAQARQAVVVVAPAPAELEFPVAAPAPEPAPAEMAPAAAPEGRPAAPARARAPAARARRSGPAAAAGRVLDAPARGPLDLRADTIVMGPAPHHAGGASAARGDVSTPGPARADDAGSRARPVGLVDPDWRCAWPREADASDREREEVIIRVVVAPDGRARTVRVLREPGGGFGRAAISCAMGTRFLPARDAAGAPHQAESPPIRVVFTR
jgi:periplasmic protein TonB